MPSSGLPRCGGLWRGVAWVTQTVPPPEEGVVASTEGWRPHSRIFMNWPATEKELAEGGYVYDTFSPCKGKTCKATIWWHLTPAKMRMPLSLHSTLNFSGEKLFEPHFASCPDVKAFRKPK